MATKRVAKGRSKPKAKRSRQPSDQAVKVRMYNTGFGDCFLLRFPGPGRELKVLIDCGKHTLSKCQPPLRDVVQQVQADIRQASPGGKPHVDVLVVTHRHLDHVSGFALDGWDDLEVGEVWMPWTEDPDDDEARRICERQSARALQLQGLLPRLNLDPTRRDHLLAYSGNNLANAGAMRRLHEGFRGNPKRRFLPKRNEEMALLQSDALPGVEVHVLGPSRSERVIRDMDPPQGEAFLRAAEAVRQGERGASPFSERWRMNRAAYQGWFACRDVPDPFGKVTEEYASHLRELMSDPEMELAAALEKAVNGTSLVLLFKVGGAVLLFPGDAQWGTWNEILEHNGLARLLKDITFYKVGHHGSHNATPRRFVDEFLPGTACAMVPTDTIDQWPLIPKTELLDALSAKGVPFIRGDKVDANDDPRFKRHVVNGHTLYIDLTLKTTA